MILLTALVKMLKMECTKAYQNGVSFIISSPKAKVEKLDLMNPFLSIVRAFQNKKG